MRNGFYGAPPHAPTIEKGIYARLRLAIRPCGDCIWDFAPCPNRGGINPTSRSYFGKKNPKSPKKPNRIRYRLSSIDSEQGCRRQPCYLFSANCSYCFSDEVEKLKVCSFKKQQRNKTKQARPSSLLLLSMGAAPLLSQEKRQSCHRLR